MTPYDLYDIKIVRKKIGLTQSELAHKSSVSQSLIAKIEAGTLDPTYSNALKIFETLNSLQKKESLKAKDFIHSGLVSCQKDDFVRDVIKKMKKYEISQLPVMENCGVSGVVSETEIISRLLVKPDKNLRVKEV
ncbi:MAG: helix-turn-helix domain-containing protein, partial [Nanoarchaeota archaeon]|nr:helix-turn-helix domain-containing protein [Nanoarchaeota archaeon]